MRAGHAFAGVYYLCECLLFSNDRITICLEMCMFMYMYIYIYIYICTHTHAYMLFTYHEFAYTLSWASYVHATWGTMPQPPHARTQNLLRHIHVNAHVYHSVTRHSGASYSHASYATTPHPSHVRT